MNLKEFQITIYSALATGFILLFLWLANTNYYSQQTLDLSIFYEVISLAFSLVFIYLTLKLVNS